MPAPSLVARDLVKSYGDRTVLDGISLTASPGDRLGLVGENGVGKSTLLSLLAGALDADSGTVTRPPDTGFLSQELPYAGTCTVRSVVDGALADVRAAERRLQQLADRLAETPQDASLLSAYGELLEWAEFHGLWDAEHRAERVMGGLGLGAVPPDRRLDALSGGQRARLGLAALLIREPAALLLDEPTNHLDDAALDFVSAELAEMPGVVVLASHDRVFLDEVCTGICDLDPSAEEGLTRYGGGYSDYLQEKRAQRERWELAWSEHQDEVDALRESVRTTARAVAPGRSMTDGDKLGYNFHGARVQRQVSRRVRNAQQRLDELTRQPIRKPPALLRLSAELAVPAPGSGPVVSVRDLVVAGRVRVDRLDVGDGARLLVTGPNGSGKSSLLAVLAGELTPTSGEVRRRRGLRMRLLAQDVTFPEPGRSAEATYRELVGGARAEEVPLHQLGLLPGPDLRRPVGALSVGQRRRLALAVVLGDPPHLLLLDEPTNHVSLALAAELEDAMKAAPGAVVVASHDRWLRRHWDGETLTLAAAGSGSGGEATARTG